MQNKTKNKQELIEHDENLQENGRFHQLELNPWYEHGRFMFLLTRKNTNSESMNLDVLCYC